MITLRNILDQHLLTTHFQPIVDLDRGAIIGHEALTRGPADTALSSPGALFAEAGRTRAVVALEEQCWASAVDSAARQMARSTVQSRLFINVLPSTLLHPGVERTIAGLLDRVRLHPSQVVIEISEGTPIDDFASFRAAISSYRMSGFGIAVDDAGAGHSGLQLVAEIVPDLIKIDSSLVREVHRHKGRRATVEALLVLARALAIEVVAEGIETRDELSALRELGVRLGQGYLLGRPAAVASSSLDPTLSLGASMHAPRSRTGAPSPDAIGRLAVACPTVNSGTELSGAVKVFEDQRVDGIVVLSDVAPVGLLMKAQVYELLGRAYGRDLYLRRPVEQAARQALIVDFDTSLESVSRSAMARDAKSLYDHVVVTDGGAFAGIVSVHRLLAAITDARVNAARNANPLTGLPGNAMIEHELRQRMRDPGRTALMHVDLDDFKAFNDAYGFHRGDLAITTTANVLSGELAATAGHHFLGHIGGDDFLVIVDAAQAEDLEARLTEEFRRRIAELYDESDAHHSWTSAPQRN
ncbi:MAG TPA: bifunctional diguanylate cyclase/phosphodiesterase, partial [Gemmatimonadaceae bacterium]